MKSIYFTDLALLYFPRSNKRSASAQLKRWIAFNTELCQRLEELHYQSNQRALTPLQEEAIRHFLGDPD